MGKPMKYYCGLTGWSKWDYSQANCGLRRPFWGRLKQLLEKNRKLSGKECEREGSHNPMTPTGQ